jgi:hypothetical protein
MGWLEPKLWLLRVVLLLVLLILLVRAAFADHVLGYVLRAPDGSRLELTFEDCRDPAILIRLPPSILAHRARGAPGPACWYPDLPSARIMLVTPKGSIAAPITFLAQEIAV